MPAHKLKVHELKKVFSSGDGVKGVNFHVSDGELVSLLGPSGCGKTTVLRAIGGFNDIDSGEVIIDGHDISGLTPDERPTSMVFQGYNLWPHMTVFENLALGLKIRKINKLEIEAQVREMLAILKMDDHINKYPDQLSGGQQQRVAIARSLLLKPKVLLMDEPFSALDAKIRRYMREELRKIQHQLGITILFVTHDQEEALSLSDRIIVMNKGNIEQVGTPDEIYHQPKTRFVAEFIGEMNFIEKGTETIAFRPEHISVAEENYDFTGVVQSKMSFGLFSKLILDTQYGEIRVAMTSNEYPNLQTNETVGLKIHNSMSI
ncbi:ABC transporter ATP-binding protein [Photobacterium rosenbergii]|uniref:ABC transporter ATP-binding protein n=1 Tax=Photobacterium rosenbergii TaxID=294936 RepID=UPI001C99E3F5|nr:ABC transporter ATP-binding protein [Photobacterium rosenbergii]MBY5943771.1 ABC transporter ATP-binding protein [Photobacterium rosenbergii]